MKQCNKCGCDLIAGENWLQSCKKHYHYACRNCDNAASRGYRRNNPEKYKAISKKNRYTISSRYAVYKSNAKKRNYLFELTKNDFALLVSSPCFYCGELQENFNGIDRVDNEIGYIVNNCVSCCKMCNYMKRKHNQELFINQCIKIAEKQKVIL